MTRAFHELRASLEMAETRALYQAKEIAEATPMRAECIEAAYLDRIFRCIDTWMAMASAAALLSACTKRRVGTVLVGNAGQVWTIGSNVSLRGGCKILEDGKCDCVHAEPQLLQRVPPMRSFLMVTTLAPCRACAGQLLAHGGCSGLIYLDTLDKPNGLDLLREHSLNPLSWYGLEVGRQTSRFTKYEKVAFERIFSSWLA